MNIGIIHGFVGGGGGSDQILFETINALREKHDVTLYTVTKPKYKFEAIIVKSLIPIYLPIFGLYQKLFESSLTKKSDNDLILVTSGSLVIPYNDFQKIVIYCHHDFKNNTKQTITKYKGIWSLYYKPYYKMVEIFLKKIKQDNVILISNSMFVHDSILSWLGKQSVMIYPPVDLDSFTTKENRLDNNVITVARYSQEKNLEFALNVMRPLKTNYAIIGNTNTKANRIYYQGLQKYIVNSPSKIRLFKNITRKETISMLKQSKVYFHTSPETFGISVVEGIAAGCIPIVPDNSAHKETVPFEELRYKQDDFKDAQQKVSNALNGKYDYLLETLDKHVKQFDKERFKESMSEYLKAITI